MPKTLIVLKPPYSEPSGIHLVYTKFVSDLLSSQQQVTLILPKPTLEIGVYTYAYEEAVKYSNLEIAWLPASYFHEKERHRLLEALTQILTQKQISHCLAFGVYDTAYISAIACQKQQIPFSVFILYQDIFYYHNLSPYELELIVCNATNIYAINPEVLEYLGYLHQTGNNLCLIRLPYNKEVFPSISYKEKSLIQSWEEPSFCATTGYLNEFTHYPDLFERVKLYTQENRCSWLHIGTIQNNLVANFFSKLYEQNLGDKFQMTGKVSRSVYYKIISQAKLIIVPLGEVNTGIALQEAKAWNIPINITKDHPFFHLSTLQSKYKNYDVSQLS